MTQAEKEKEKGATQEELFGLNKGRHADIQILHIQTNKRAKREAVAT